MSEVVRVFKLSPAFLAEYEGKQPKWGPVGYITYKRTYARKKPDGSSEEFWETCKRVVEGCYYAQKKRCHTLGLVWDNAKAQRSAQEMFQRMWEFKWLPPGRGLWMMGTDYIERTGAAALNNCGFVSTEGIAVDFADPFCWLMDMLMLGVGVGFDVKGAGLIKIQEPRQGDDVHVVEDSREGWVELLRRTLTAYTGKGSLPKEIDYSLVRGEGEPIKGFGGTASGPKPLDELIASVKDILDPLIGELITGTAIVDICNLVGRCVVAGNVRRSAEIAFGDYKDNDFLDLKNTSVWGEEIIYHHRWASNNSIFAEVGMDYSDVAERTAINGEPGYEWLENAQAYSRMGREPNWKDRRVAGANPCVTGDTWVHTSEGLRQVWTLEGKQFTAIVNGKPYLSGPSGFWKTGEKKVFEVCSDKGYSFKATANHLIQVQRAGVFEWIPVENLNEDDLLVLSNNREYTTWGDGTKSDFAEGYLIGHVLGDGTLKKSKAVFSVWDKDGPGCVGMMQEVLDSIRELRIQHRSDWQGWTPVKGRGEHRLRSAALKDFFSNYYGMDYIKKCPNLVTIQRKNSEFYKGFLRGLFDTDGSVQGTQDKGISIRFTQTDLELIYVMQNMLLNLGIVSKVYKDRQPARIADLPNGKEGTSSYECVACHELIISNDSIIQFRDVIGFSHLDKKDRLDFLISQYKRNPNKDKFLSKLTSIREIGVKPVYDAEVSDVHAFSANGVIVHNCVEQSLEDRELCCLVETFPGNHDSYEDYERTLKVAYLYAKSVTLIPTHDKRTNQVLLRNRRIGTSMSGIVQAVKKHGRREFFNWCDSGYSYLKTLDKKYSDWLCVRESIKITSVKPSGTVSLLPGVTPGIHFPHSEYYIRRIRFNENHPLVAILRNHGYHVEKDKYSPNTVVAEFPIRERLFDRSKDEVSMWEQLELAAQMQQYWADNQVSVTVTFTSEEAKDIKYALELYEVRLKGVSFLPLSDHGYVQAPYETITADEYNEKMEGVTPINAGADIEHDQTERFCDGDACVLEF